MLSTAASILNGWVGWWVGGWVGVGMVCGWGGDGVGMGWGWGGDGVGMGWVCVCMGVGACVGGWVGAWVGETKASFHIVSINSLNSSSESAKGLTYITDSALLGSLAGDEREDARPNPHAFVSCLRSFKGRDGKHVAQRHPEHLPSW